LGDYSVLHSVLAIYGHQPVALYMAANNCAKLSVFNNWWDIWMWYFFFCSCYTKTL